MRIKAKAPSCRQRLSSAACALRKKQTAFACFASLALRSMEYVPPSLCSCTKRRGYPPEKSASPLPFAPANAPPEGEKLLPKEGIFLISTAVVQADSRFQYAKAAQPFALCVKFPPCQQCASATESRRVSVLICSTVL